jgi:hypothetical protein
MAKRRKKCGARRRRAKTCKVVVVNGCKRKLCWGKRGFVSNRFVSGKRRRRRRKGTRRAFGVTF